MRVQRPARNRSARAAETPAADAAAPLAARVLALQRAAGNRATAQMLERPTLQRALRHNPDELGALTYDNEEAEGTQVTLDALVTAVLKAAPGLKGKEAEIRKRLKDYKDDDPPDFAYNTIASVVEWLALEGIEAEDVSETVESEDEGEKSDEGGKAEKKEEEGQTVGKLFFPGDSYHLTVKKAVIKAIGVKKLSFLVYGDKAHHNFNLWFEKDGSIFADQNSNRNNKGVPTGYRWDGTKAVKQ